jgi:hypothetical protein
MSIEDLVFDDFENVLNAVSNVGAWEWDTDFSNGSPQTVARKAEITEAEGRFTHSDTEGVLYVRLPDLAEIPGCMNGLLEQPFYPQDPQESTFSRKVGESTGKLVPDSESDYITPHYDAATVLALNVPIQYQIEKVETAAQIASEVSVDVAELYRKIRGSIETEDR